jgi:hypothetical protein
LRENLAAERVVEKHHRHVVWNAASEYVGLDEYDPMGSPRHTVTPLPNAYGSTSVKFILPHSKNVIKTGDISMYAN